IRVIVCPHLTLARREAMRERRFLAWLVANPPAGRRGDWAPFLDGWRFLSYAGGALHGHQFEVRLFHSGATAWTADMNDIFAADVLMLQLLEQFLDLYALQPAGKACEFFCIPGPITVQVSVHRLAGQSALDRTNTWIANMERGKSDPLARDFAFDE